MSFDISTLPVPTVIEPLSFDAIRDEILADLVIRYPDTFTGLLPSDPAYKVAEVAAYRELLLRARYNDEARALLLAFSTGPDLDHIGTTYYSEARLTITPANPLAIPPIPAVMESDDDYRMRCATKPESYSCAGSTEAYEWHAKSADGQVKSAKATSPIPGTTNVYVLSRTGNGVPTQALLDNVAAALTPEKVRPLSEEVNVLPAEVVPYVLNVDLYVYQGPAQEPLLSSATGELNKLVANSHVLKGYVARSAIDAKAHSAGVKRVVINSPAADIACADHQAPYCTAVNVRVAGVE